MSSSFREMIDVLIDFALVAFSKKNYKKSFDLLKQAYDIARNVGYEDLAIRINSIIKKETKEKDLYKQNSIEDAANKLLNYSTKLEKSEK